MYLFITINDVVTSLITGLTSSIVFLFLLWNLKPKFKITTEICCEDTKYNGEIRKVYLFKVINRSCFFRVYDVKAIAKIVTPEKNINGTNNLFTPLKIEFNTTSMVPTFNPCHYFQNWIYGEDSLKRRTDYAIKFFTLTDCRAILNNNEKHIVFEISAKHSLTGFSKVKTMKYAHVSKVKDGAFLSGNTFKIAKQPERAVIITT